MRSSSVRATFTTRVTIGRSTACTTWSTTPLSASAVGQPVRCLASSITAFPARAASRPPARNGPVAHQAVPTARCTAPATRSRESSIGGATVNGVGPSGIAECIGDAAAGRGVPCGEVPPAGSGEPFSGVTDTLVGRCGTVGSGCAATWVAVTAAADSCVLDSDTAPTGRPVVSDGSTGGPDGAAAGRPFSGSTSRRVTASSMPIAPPRITRRFNQWDPLFPQ